MYKLRVNHKAAAVASALLSALIMVGCGSSDSTPSVPTPTPTPTPVPTPPPASTDVTLNVTITNLTARQPFLPTAIVVGDARTIGWVDGQPASVGLEKLAEGAILDDYVTELMGAGGVAKATSTSPLPFGQTASYDVTYAPSAGRTLTVTSMLVHTNDAFTGITGLPIGDIAVGETRTYMMPTWDSGTEDNDEQGAHIPGPDFGKEGFNPVRNDPVPFVHYHQGVVSKDDGFATSDLRSQHRFDNPTMRIIIKRTK
jgi:hypothetical protein